MFVRRHKIPQKSLNLDDKRASRQHTCAEESSSSNVDEMVGRQELQEAIQDVKSVKNGPQMENVTNESHTTHSSDQARRLRLVSTQAFLYVSFFLMCNMWTGATGVIEGFESTREGEMQLVVDYYAFFFLEAVLTPLQGVFNCFVFIRPKLTLCATAFPRESRLWVLRRTILGTRIKPTCSAPAPSRAIIGPRGAPVGPSGAIDPNKPSATRLPRDMISSVTASDGDFDSGIVMSNAGTEERWTNNEKVFSSILSNIPIRFESLRNPKSSALEVISENEPSNFEPMSQLEMSSSDFFPTNAESRWASDSSGNSSTSGGGRHMDAPKRKEELTFETPDRSSSFRHLNLSRDQNEQAETGLSTDQPIITPQLRASSGVGPLQSPEACSSNHDGATNDTNVQVKETIAADMPIKPPVRRGSLDL